MPDVTCIRCTQTREALLAPPFPNELGAKILGSICQVCWKDWLRQQTQIINHYALDLRDPKARQMLMQQTETFLFGAPTQK
jgi:Fe-S cluster biosynthesis and repair protein YggX